MEFYEAVYGRRSIRSFDSKRDLSKELVDKLLKAATCAPSAGNTQPWRFWVIRDKNIKEEMVEVAYGQRFIAEASVVIVVCADIAASLRGYGERGRNLYAIQDTAAAVENLLLAVYSEGLGACWVGAFSEEACAATLNLPKNIRPVAIIPVGYPLREGRKASKINFKDVTKYL